MNGDAPISWLMFFTLVAGLFVIVGGFLQFIRSQRNRDIAAETLTGDGSRSPGMTANGALPDLLGLGLLAAIAMGLLALGYSHKSNAETSQVPPPVSGSPVSGSMTQPVGSADQPKQYQPANPVPDQRAAPTSSPAGVGPDNGSKP